MTGNQVWRMPISAKSLTTLCTRVNRYAVRYTKRISRINREEDIRHKMTQDRKVKCDQSTDQQQTNKMTERNTQPAAQHRFPAECRRMDAALVNRCAVSCAQ